MATVDFADIIELATFILVGFILAQSFLNDLVVAIIAGLILGGVTLYIGLQVDPDFL